MLRTKLSDLVRERIEKNKNLETKIREQEKEITKKDDRNAQLHALFQGTAKIFSKQHNYVDQLKQQLEQEIKEKGISEEKAKHLENGVRIYANWKNELAKKLTELEEASKENQKERDQELQDLKAKNNNLTKLVKELTEVKMAREKSEERLKKQSEEFLKVQEMNQVVYDILGAESDKKGLLLRSQEVVKKLETQKKELKKTKADLQKELSWWDKWINDEKGIIRTVGGVREILYHDDKKLNPKESMFNKEEIANAMSFLGHDKFKFAIYFYKSNSPSIELFFSPNYRDEGMIDVMKKSKMLFKNTIYEGYKNKP